MISLVAANLDIGGNAGISAQTSAPTDGGNGGNISVEVHGNAEIHNGGRISTATQGSGAGGSIAVTASELMVSGGSISADTSQSAGGGRAGNIHLAAWGTVTLNGGGQISSSTFGSGDGGQISAYAGQNIVLQNGTISTRSTATGRAGDITLNAGWDIVLLPVSRITAEAAVADGGNIHLSAYHMVWLESSEITAYAGGDGAQISIDPIFVILNHSTIDGRSGGNPVYVTIDPDAIFIKSPDSQILTSAASLPPELDLAGTLAGLSVSLLKGETMMRDRCEVKALRDFSSLTVTDRGGFPIEPNAWLPSFHLKPTVEKDEDRKR
jgi:hypothetical protein